MRPPPTTPTGAGPAPEPGDAERAAPEEHAAAERAAAEACGWLEAGARGVALLAPAGEARRRTLAALAARAPRPFALARIAAREGHAAGSVLVRADAAVRRYGGAPTVLVVDQAELLAPDEARALRAIADHAPADVRLVALLAPRPDTPALLRALGPGVEWVTYAPAPPTRTASSPSLLEALPRRSLVQGATGLLAAVSLGVALGLVLPRFDPGPEPAVASPGADVAAAPPPSGPAAARGERKGASARRDARPLGVSTAARESPPPSSHDRAPARLVAAQARAEPRSPNPGPGAAPSAAAPPGPAREEPAPSPVSAGTRTTAQRPSAPAPVAVATPPSAPRPSDPTPVASATPPRGPDPSAPAPLAMATPPPAQRRPDPVPAAAGAAPPAAAAPAPARAEVAAARGTSRVRPAGGYLFVNALPRARIRVDGVAAGETPVVRFPLERGRHQVVAEFADGRREERSIEAVGAETYVVFGGTR